MRNVFLAFLLIYTVISNAQQKTYVISSGSRGGNYYETGKILDSILNKQYPTCFFKNIWSGGSNDNLDNLENKKADLALVQHNILLQNFFDVSKGEKNIEVIMPLFKEELQIYCKNILPKSSIQKLINDLNINEKIKIGVTNRKSYSYELLKHISQLLNLPLNKAHIIEADYDDLIDLYKKDSINYLVTFSLNLKALDNVKMKSNIYFSEKDVDFILSRTKNLFKIKHTDKFYNFGTYTYLIGLKPQIEELDNIYPIFNTLLNNLEKSHTFLGHNIKQNLNDFITLNEHSLVNFLPLNDEFSSNMLYQEKNNYTIYMSIILLLIVLLFFILRKRIFHFFSTKKIKKIWYRYNHFLFGILLLIILYELSIELMIYGEKELDQSVNIKSQIINMPRSKLHFWLIISNLSQNNDGIFPVSSLAKLMYSLSFYTLWIGGICIAIVEILVKRIIKKRNNGIMKIKYTNHTVITGWNINTELFIKDYFSAKKDYFSNDTKLVLVIENAKKLRDENAYIRELVNTRELSIINGDIREEDISIMANVYQAKTVVLFAEDNTTRADEKTLLRALSISRHCRKLSLQENKRKQSHIKSTISVEVNKYIDSIYIIAEVNNLLYEEDLYKADVNEVVCSAIYSKNIITQSIFNHGVSRVLDEVLNYNELNEFYEIDLKLEENAKLRNKTFDELLFALRKVNILLIAIHKLYYNSKTDEQIIDRDEIKRLLTGDNLTREIIINPQNEIENKHEADADDGLIVLCSSEKVLRKKIRDLEI